MQSEVDLLPLQARPQALEARIGNVLLAVHPISQIGWCATNALAQLAKTARHQNQVVARHCMMHACVHVQCLFDGLI
jgi:hypothetical protein